MKEKLASPDALLQVGPVETRRRAHVVLTTAVLGYSEGTLHGTRV